MPTTMLRFFLFVVALWCAVLVQAEERTFYAAIFGITIDASGNLIGFRLAGVTDPLSGSENEVDIQLPPQYLAAARVLVLSKNYPPIIEDGKPKEFFTWFFYVPSQPGRVDLDPTKAQ